MTFEQTIKQLKSNNFASIYFLMGDESYFIDLITEYIINNSLEESERDFNQTILYGKDTDIHTIISTARRFPMMAKRQLVVVKEAQNIKNIDILSSYIDKPLESTILVINYKNKSLDKRKKLCKQIDKAGVLFESKKLYDNQIPDWINQYCQSKKYNIEAKASFLLSEFLGNDLSKISNEIDKLAICIEDGKSISSEFIEKNIGISKDYNNFELQNALGIKDILKCNRIINYFSNNPKNNPLVVTISLLYSYFSKLLKYYFIKNKSNERLVASSLGVSPYFIKDYRRASRHYTAKKLVEIIALLREYDLKSKGVNNTSTSNGELLKELIFKILH